MDLALWSQLDNVLLLLIFIKLDNVLLLLILL